LRNLLLSCPRSHVGSSPLPSLPRPLITWSLCHCSPAYGGRPCSGSMFEYQICNSEDCPGPYEDFRAQQCAKRNSYYTHQDAKHSWLPYEPDSGEWLCSAQLLGMFLFLFSQLSRPKDLGVRWGTRGQTHLSPWVSCTCGVTVAVEATPDLHVYKASSFERRLFSRDAHSRSQSSGRISAVQMSVLSCT
jgi:hypothetical protein